MSTENLSSSKDDENYQKIVVIEKNDLLYPPTWQCYCAYIQSCLGASKTENGQEKIQLRNGLKGPFKNLGLA